MVHEKHTVRHQNISGTLPAPSLMKENYTTPIFVFTWCVLAAISLESNHEHLLKSSTHLHYLSSEWWMDMWLVHLLFSLSGHSLLWLWNLYTVIFSKISLMLETITNTVEQHMAGHQMKWQHLIQWGQAFFHGCYSLKLCFLWETSCT